MPGGPTRLFAQKCYVWWTSRRLLMRDSSLKNQTAVLS
jgi:hypothetical protein